MCIRCLRQLTVAYKKGNRFFEGQPCSTIEARRPCRSNSSEASMSARFRRNEDLCVKYSKTASLDITPVVVTSCSRWQSTRNPSADITLALSFLQSAGVPLQQQWKQRHTLTEARARHRPHLNWKKSETKHLQLKKNYKITCKGRKNINYASYTRYITHACAHKTNAG